MPTQEHVIVANEDGTELPLRIAAVNTAAGPALNVNIGGAVISVNLDLADDEVAVGGPDAAGDRRLFRGRDNGDGTNTIETVTQPGTSGTQGQTAVTDAGVTVLAANTARRYVLIWNVGADPVDLFLGAAGAFGAGVRLVAPFGGTQWPLRLEYTGRIDAITNTGLTSTVTFVEVND